MKVKFCYQNVFRDIERGIIKLSKTLILLLILLISLPFSDAMVAQSVNNCEGFVSSGGRKFWLTVPANPLGATAPSIHVNLVGPSGTTGTISILDNSFTPINFTIPANGFYEVDLPAAAVQVSGNQVTLNKGILLEGNDDFNVYVISEEQFTTEGYLGIPTSGLGTEYYVITYNGLGATAESQATVVASQNGTNETLTRPNGQIHNVILNEGQVYSIQDPSTGDLTGTRVLADRPVAVFGSVKCANVPTGTGTCDYIVEQMFPIASWDVEFVVPPLPADGQMFRVMAGEASTQVFRNGTLVATLNKGEFWTSAAISNPTAIERFTSNNKKIQVAQYATGNQTNGATGPGYDPAFGLVPAKAIWLKKHIFKSQPNFTNNLLMVTTTTTTSNVTVNGAAISPTPTWAAISGTDLSWAKIALAAGAVYTVENIEEIGLTVFGGKVDESYLLPGNLSLGDLDMDGVRNIVDCDADGDGILNSVEQANALAGTNGDSDMDGIVDELDLDSDNDGIPDNIEAQSTAGYLVPTGTVTANGLDLAYPDGLTPYDNDSDLTPDYLDLDSDGAGTGDAIETEITLAGIDSDSDGLDDAVDTDDDNFGPKNAGITNVLSAYPNNGTEVNWRILGNTAPEISNGGGNASHSVDFVTDGTSPVDDYNATDADGETENGGGLSWSIVGGVDAALFSIDANTGSLTFSTPPNFTTPTDMDANNDYELIIQIKDMSGEIDLQNLTVNVLQNNPPTIISPNTATIIENTTAVTDAQANDDFDTENDGLTYSFSGILANSPDEALFSINPTTGIVSFQSSPDFENPQDAGANNVYQVEIQVCDSGNLCDTETLTISVTNVNDVAPTITNNGSAVDNAVDFAENATSNVLDYNATDADNEIEGTGINDQLDYTLSGIDAGLFTISDAGLLTFIAAPDFENPTDNGNDNIYDVTITVTDGVGQTDSQDLAVTVTDVTDVAPTIVNNNSDPSNSTTFLENSTGTIINYDANDIEGESEGTGASDELDYSLTGVDAGLFAITDDGVLTFLIPPDFENPTDSGMDNEYIVTVNVCDSGSFCDTQTLTISILDEDEDGDGYTAQTPIVDTDDANPCVPDNTSSPCCEAQSPNISKD